MRWSRVLTDPSTGRRVPVYVLLLTAGVTAQFMSEHAADFGFPISPERLLLPAGFLLFAVSDDLREMRWSCRPVHLALLAFAGWCVASLAWFGTADLRTAVFALLDAVGIFPFLLFCIAPVAFGTAYRRRVLALALTVVGAYLGVTALLEGMRLYDYVWPSYIYDPTSSHFGRAAGPSTQVASNGLQLFGCGVAALVVTLTPGPVWGRRAAAVVAGLCALGGLFTLTRSVWIGFILGIGAAMLTYRPLRRWFIAAAVAGSALIASILTLDSGLREGVLSRATDGSTALDRVQATDAALNVIAAHPLVGIGFHNFPLVEVDWLWQSSDAGIAATGIAVHNVILGYATELGLPGAALFVLALALAALGAISRGSLRDAGEMRVWRLGALAYAVCWLTIGMFVPMTYGQPASFLWLFLGFVTPAARLGFEPRAAAAEPISGHPNLDAAAPHRHREEVRA